MKKTGNLLLSFILSTGLFAQPANDECLNAITLTSNTTCNTTSGTVNNATPDGFNQASCDNAPTSLGAGVFYKFTAVSTTHTVQVTPAAGASLDAVVVVYSGANCFNLSSEIACQDPQGSGPVTVPLTNLTVNQVYYIRLYDWGANNTTSGNFTICVTHQQQNCNFTFSPSSETHGPNAFSTTFTQDDIIMNGQPNCTYTVSESCNWLTITNPTSSPATANSNGQAFLNYSITANNTGSARTCTITVNGQNVTITQNPCLFDFSPVNNSNVPASGTTYNLDVETNTDCTWNIQTGCNWVSLNTNSGTGDGTVSVTVSPNTDAQVRNCTLSIGNTTHIITQQGAPCTYSIPGSSQNFSAQAGQGNFVVNATAGCAWTATESCSWVTLTSASGTGNGSVTYTVDANTGTQRSCTITVNGQTYTITQDGTPPSCTYSISPQNVTPGHIAGSQVINVAVSSGTNCSWTPTVSGNCPWLQVSPSTAQTGSGSFTITYTTNADTASRTCQVNITGTNQSITITQAGNTGATSCPNPLPTPQLSINGCQLSISPLANVVYQWYFNNQPISSTNSNVLNATSGAGSYYVEVTSLLNTACTAQSASINLNCPVGITQPTGNKIQVHPNPTSNVFVIDYETPTPAEINLEVFDITGRLMLTQTTQSSAGSHTLNGTLLNNPSGLYVVKLQINNTPYYFKLQKQQ